MLNKNATIVSILLGNLIMYKSVHVLKEKQ